MNSIKEPRNNNLGASKVAITLRRDDSQATQPSYFSADPKNSPRIVVLLVCGLCIGCAENPGTWPQDKVHAKIVERLELTDVELTPKEGGGYKGTGMYGEETISFTITQDPEAHRLSWDAKGDRGLSDSGFYELK